MRVSSFGLRIGLVSAAVAGVVVFVFGVSSWALIYKADQDRVDGEIQARLLGFLATRHHGQHWRNADQGADAIGDEYRDGPWTILVRNEEDRVVYQSPTWPDALSTSLLQIPPPDDGGRDAANRADLPPPMRRGLPGGPPRHPLPPPMPHTPLRFRTFQASGRSWRIAASANPNMTMLLGMDLSASASQMRAARNAFLLALPVALLLAASGSMLIARRALQPIVRLTRAVEGISATDLAQRIATERADGEFRRLISVFNAMMERLESSFQQAARFSADAAHELNTPLTILQGHLDCAIQGASPGSEEQRELTGLLEQVERLKGIVRDLLLIARADAGQLARNPEPVDLTEMFEHLREDIDVMAPHLAISAELAPAVTVMADRALLLRVLHNLASNAVKHNTGEGWIRIELGADEVTARATFSNSGPEIAAADRDRLFDRFFRTDPSRTRHGSSTGLGLSLAREIARAHGGDLTLKTAQNGAVAFELTLPGPR